MITKEFLEGLKSSSIPKLECGSAKTIKEFYENCVEKYMPSEDIIHQWDEILNKYVMEPAPILFIRRYNSAANKQWTAIRRGFLTTYDNDFGYVFCDNFLAHYFYAMAFMGYVPEYEDFRSTILQREFPYGSRETTEEIAFRAYPKGKSVNLNSAGWKLAHLFSVNKNDYNFNYKLEANNLFPRGEQMDWEQLQGMDYPERKIRGTVTLEERGKMVAHFLRVVHPINYFLVPMQKFETDDYYDNIGEMQELIDYVYYKQKQKYPNILSRFEENIMAKSKPINNVEVVGDRTINITYGRNIKKSNNGNVLSSNKSEKSRRTSSGQMSETVSSLEEKLGKELIARSRKYYTSIDNTTAVYFIESNTMQPNGTNWFDIHEDIVQKLLEHKLSYLVLIIRDKGKYFIPLTNNNFLNNKKALVECLTNDLRVKLPSGKYKWSCYLYSNYFTIRKKQCIFYVEANNLEKITT